MKNNFPLYFDSVLEAPQLYGLIPIDIILDPTLIISIDENSGNIIVKLAAIKYVKGEEKLFFAPSICHNYVISDNKVYPLPRGTLDEISMILDGRDITSISFSEIFKVKNFPPKNIKIKLHKNLFNSAAQNSSFAIKTYTVSNLLKASLYSYQKQGVAWISKILSNGSGLILADEMGLGKTVQVIAAILDLSPTPESPILIICPTSLIDNWVAEIHKFAPHLSILIHQGPERRGIVNALKKHPIVLSTYDTVVNDEMLIKAINWRCLICDEAQALKNPDSIRRNIIATLPRQSCLLMTGTPVETSLLDLWSLLDIALPGILSTRDSFSKKFPDNETSANLLNDIVSPLILRRTVAQVANDLPERINIELPISLGSVLEEEYNNIRQQALDEYRISGGLVATTRLSIFCAHPSLSYGELESVKNSDDVEPINPLEKCIITPKIELTLSLLNKACIQNKKVLIFTNYNRMGDILKKISSHIPITYWNSINGSTPQEDRQKIIDTFTSHEGNGVLILNPKAAGAGLNITTATVVIHYTPVWNPALEMQASARAHRRGQTLPVTVYSLFYKGTVEQVMLERAQYRKELGNRVIPIISDDSNDIVKALNISPYKIE